MAQYEEDLSNKKALSDVKTDVSLNVGFVYDAMWTIALALNSSISTLAKRGLERLEDFTYSSKHIKQPLTEIPSNDTLATASVNTFAISTDSLVVGRSVI